MVLIILEQQQDQFYAKNIVFYEIISWISNIWAKYVMCLNFSHEHCDKWGISDNIAQKCLNDSSPRKYRSFQIDFPLHIVFPITDVKMENAIATKNCITDFQKTF